MIVINKFLEFRLRRKILKILNKGDNKENKKLNKYINNYFNNLINYEKLS